MFTIFADATETGFLGLPAHFGSDMLAVALFGVLLIVLVTTAARYG